MSSEAGLAGISGTKSDCHCTGWTVNIPASPAPSAEANPLRISLMVAEQAALGSARERVIEAAERVVADVGAARLTLDAVAHAAGVSKGGLLYHFPSKESLLVALSHRYVDSIHGCIDSVRTSIADGPAQELKACVQGILGSNQCMRAMSAVLLATAANDLKLLEVIRERMAEHVQELSTSTDFARAAIVALAVDGLMMRESLRISPFSAEQREAVVNKLLELADEAYR
jgi:AcrR family transcriptional regulator